MTLRLTSAERAFLKDAQRLSEDYESLSRGLTHWQLRLLKIWHGCPALNVYKHDGQIGGMREGLYLLHVPFRWVLEQEEVVTAYRPSVPEPLARALSMGERRRASVLLEELVARRGDAIPAPSRGLRSGNPYTHACQNSPGFRKKSRLKASSKPRERKVAIDFQPHAHRVLGEMVLALRLLERDYLAPREFDVLITPKRQQSVRVRGRAWLRQEKLVSFEGLGNADPVPTLGKRRCVWRITSKGQRLHKSIESTLDHRSSQEIQVLLSDAFPRLFQVA